MSTYYLRLVLMYMYLGLQMCIYLKTKYSASLSFVECKMFTEFRLHKFNACEPTNKLFLLYNIVCTASGIKYTIVY